MGIIASGQITLEPITAIDGYVIDLSRESYVFVGDSAGAQVGSTCETQVVAYCGNQICSKVDITNIQCPEGITSTIVNNGSSSPTIVFETTVVLTSEYEATITIVVDEVTIDKHFSFAVAMAGVGIKSSEVAYQFGSSDTEAPTGEWSKTVPENDVSLPYLWSRTIITYTDETTSTTYSVGATPESIVIGGRNLIRNSRDLVYEKYYFKEDIIVTHDDEGNLTWVSPAVTVMSDDDGNITIVASDDGNGNVILSLE